MKKLFLVLGMVLALAGCGTYEQTVQVDDKAYLLIIGDPAGGIATIDNGTPLTLGKDTVSFDLNGQTATKIEIPIGSHTIRITKNGELRVNRKFYVSTGNSFEVRL